MTAADIADGTLTINHETALHTNLRVLFNLYNMLAAYAVAAELGVSPSLIAEVISDYTFRNGRIRSWNQNGREIALLTSKHENSTSYDQSIDLAVRRGGDVLFIVDAVSRKYFTGETSLLWDINFELLRADSIRTIYLAGKYVYDLANRLDYTDIPKNRIRILPTLDDIRDVFQGTNDLYVITCFSDREKFLSRLPGDAAERKENL